MLTSGPLQTRAELTRLGWIPANSHLCTFRLDDSARANGNGLKCYCLSVAPVHVPTDCSSPETEIEFHRDLFQMPRNMH